MGSRLARGTLPFVLTALLAAAGARADEPGTARGKLTVAGKTTPLSYAYARAQKGFFDKAKDDVLVILSDVPIPETALGDEFARHRMASEGKLHAVEVVLNSEKQAVSGGLLHDAFSKTNGYVSVAGMHEFKPTIFDGKQVAGSLGMDKPNEFMGNTFEYSATFSAPVWHRSPPTATGAAAAQTAAGKATLAFLSAARAGRISELKKVMSAGIARELDGPDGKTMRDALKNMAPDPKTAEIESADILGDAAEVTVVEKSKDGSVTSKIRLALEHGAWKVTGM
jgi:hypothetical protein